MEKTKREPTPQWMRETVFRRDDYTCQYCGSREKPLHADHVYPYSKGGETSVENLVTACRKCNGRKSNKIGLWPREIVRIEKTPFISVLLFGNTVMFYLLYKTTMLQFVLYLTVLCFVASFVSLFFLPDVQK